MPFVINRNTLNRYFSLDCRTYLISGLHAVMGIVHYIRCRSFILIAIFFRTSIHIKIKTISKVCLLVPNNLIKLRGLFIKQCLSGRQSQTAGTIFINDTPLERHNILPIHQYITQSNHFVLNGQTIIMKRIQYRTLDICTFWRIQISFMMLLNDVS